VRRWALFLKEYNENMPPIGGVGGSSNIIMFAQIRNDYDLYITITIIRTHGHYLVIYVFTMPREMP
jgi:hypothetical protein